MKKVFLLVFIMFGLLLTGCSNKVSEETKVNFKKAEVKTDSGTFVFELNDTAAPKTVENFEKKSSDGKYNGLTFHRVEDWVLQGGDPIGNGTGGGDQPTELSQEKFREGSVGVARAGDIKISNDSQFFICKTDCSFLTGQYTYFGQVTDGMDVVKKMKIGDKIDSITIK